MGAGLLSLARAFWHAGLLSLLMSAAAIPASARADDATIDQLRRVASKRIFFGHQSVGHNLLDGIRDLAREARVELDIVEGGPGFAADGPCIVHSQLGQNTQPLTKLEAFDKAMGAAGSAPAKIAFFKFCYVDFTAETDVEALFARYVKTHDALRQRHPDVTFVHVTVPLTVTQGGIKGYVKNLIGRGAWGERENVKRHEFNELMRARYAGKEPIFDLARVESTWEDGRPNGFERDGKFYPSLVRAYTDDGEHLNERGRRHAARALIALLASLE